MKISKFTASAVGIYLSLLTGVDSAFAGDSAIQLTPPQLYCRSDRGWVTFGMYILGKDHGRPGAAFVGAHEPAFQHSAFMTPDGNWYNTDGGSLVPAFADLRDGMRPVIFDFPLDLSNMEGWPVYVGYGVLTSADEAELAAQQATYEAAKAKAATMGRTVTLPDPEQLKRQRAQDDMTKNKKYQYVGTMTTGLRAFCQPCYKSGRWTSAERQRCSRPSVSF